MTYREAYMKCNTLSELETMVKKDIVAVKLLGSSDRIKVIKDTADEVANLKFKENENEKYIEIIKSLDCENITSITCDYKKTGCSDCDFMLAKNKAIKALEEIQQYRAFGTVEGFERAIKSSIENYNLYREYKAKVQEFETIGTIEEFKALKEKKHIGKRRRILKQ